MEGVQNLEEDRGRFAFKLDERRNDSLLNAFKNKLCVVEIIVNFIAELLYGLIIFKVLARDERGTQLQKRRDAFWSCCLVSRVKCLGGNIEAKRPIGFH
jgi:hypothetical protein